MICSVKNRDRYLYYDAGAVSPPQSPMRGLLGVAIDEALPLLPRGARLVGSGVVARGTLCRSRTPSGLSGFGDANVGTLLAGALAVLGAYILFRR